MIPAMKSAAQQISLLRDITSLFTAPYRESVVASYVERFVKARRSLRLSRDKTGNLLIERKTSKPSRRRLVVVAHMDHPGFIARETIDAKTIRAEFRGGVMADFVRGCRVKFLVDGIEVSGKVVECEAHANGRAKMATVKVTKPVPPNSPGMFDLGVAKVKGKKLYSRAVDDLGGVAAALAALDESDAKSDLAVLLTRAEEDGFIGAIAAVNSGELLRKTDLLISIECSAEQPAAPMGKGAVVRVGDRTSIFHSAFTRFVTQTAETIAAKDKSFQFNRALMPGGTCEATVFDAWGFVTAAVCVPLGNYHNMNRETQKLGPEYIDTGDWLNLVKLLTELGRQAHTFTGDHSALKQKLNGLLAENAGNF